jgi:hypothetical protein
MQRSEIWTDLWVYAVGVLATIGGTIGLITLVG